jgi:hypothetical protein
MNFRECAGKKATFESQNIDRGVQTVIGAQKSWREVGKGVLKWGLASTV